MSKCCASPVDEAARESFPARDPRAVTLGEEGDGEEPCAGEPEPAPRASCCCDGLRDEEKRK